MTRLLKPNVFTTPDQPIVQVRCEPEKDEINVDDLLRLALSRFEFVLGTSFDLQFVSLDGSQVLALRRYIVTKVAEEVVTSEVSHYQTMTKTITRRTCAPLTELMVFDACAASLLGKTAKPAVEKPNAKEVDIDNMSTSDLQTIMKQLTGRGFPVGTKHSEMVETVRKHM